MKAGSDFQISEIQLIFGYQKMNLKYLDTLNFVSRYQFRPLQVWMSFFYMPQNNPMMPYRIFKDLYTSSIYWNDRKLPGNTLHSRIISNELKARIVYHKSSPRSHALHVINHGYNTYKCLVFTLQVESLLTQFCLYSRFYILSNRVNYFILGCVMILSKILKETNILCIRVVL